jgi:hypothetical protein
MTFLVNFPDRIVRQIFCWAAAGVGLKRVRAQKRAGMAGRWRVIERAPLKSGGVFGRIFRGQ